MVELSAQNVVMDSFLDTQSRANSLKWFTLVYAYLAKYGQRVSLYNTFFRSVHSYTAVAALLIVYSYSARRHRKRFSYVFWITLNVIQHYSVKQVVPRPPMWDHGGGPMHDHDDRRMVVAMTYSMSRWVTCFVTITDIWSR